MKIIDRLSSASKYCGRNWGIFTQKNFSDSQLGYPVKSFRIAFGSFAIDRGDMAVKWALAGCA